MFKNFIIPPVKTFFKYFVKFHFLIAFLKTKSKTASHAAAMEVISSEIQTRKYGGCHKLKMAER